MLSERLLTTLMRRNSDRYLTLADVERHELPNPVPGRNYMLYVHIPFCERLCPYCSFNRYAYDQTLADAYFVNLRRELEYVAEKGYDFQSMYVGGGTPTIDLQQLCEIIDLAKELFSIVEVSSETNPNHLIPEYVEPLRTRVDRFSVGVQSFDDELLKQMDRYEKYGSAYEILERIQETAGQFHSLNVDMIFNFPSQTPEKVRFEAEMMKGTGANQVTWYPLMASPSVNESLKKTVGAVSYNREARYYHMISEIMSDGFEPASAWTFSRTEGGMIDEYIVDYEDYVGVGSGAFSFLEGSLYVNTFSLKRYNDLVSEGHSSVTGKRVFGKGDRMRYRFLMQLFGLELDKRGFERDFGLPIEQGLPIEMAYMRAAGAFQLDDATRLVPNEKGRYLLVAMMRQFFIGVNNLRDQARAALPADERLLFGEGNGCAEHDRHPLAAAGVETETAESRPVPR
ncbi:MAG: coproporphyrinogen III oxidase family protein [Coriobacteriales bacterium]|nr:coproporphyrinogen III oxidase family protein [Coriobacteriales bacterium]